MSFWPPTVMSALTVISRLTRLPLCTTKPVLPGLSPLPSWPNWTAIVPTLVTARLAAPDIVNVWSAVV